MDIWCNINFRWNRTIITKILKYDTFYQAEEYHQDYLKKNPNGYCPDLSTGIVFNENQKNYLDN